MDRIVIIAPYCLTVCAQACTLHSVYIGVVMYMVMADPIHMCN